MTILIENQDSFFFATPASLLDLERDVASSWASKHIVPNKAIKWILGKYVEADNANSNGQYWSLKDLQMKRPTITYSPMNIGHRPENIVGTFVASDLIYPLGEDGAALQTNPYIEALGAYWKYYFPEQLVKIEEAYSTGSLFLSMECIGSSITCVNGENACGETFPYHGPMHDSYCFPGETLISMEDGTKKKISDISIGDRVLTHNGSSIVSALFERDYNGDLIALRYYGMSEPILTTPNHPVRRFIRDEKCSLTFDIKSNSKRWEWIPAEDLKKEDFVELGYTTEVTYPVLDMLELFSDELEVREDGRVYKKTVNPSGRKSWNGLPRFIELTESIMVLAGLYTAEGSLWKDGVNWALHQDELEAIDALKLALDKYEAGSLGIYTNKNSKGIQARVTNVPLKYLLKYLCGEKSREKSLSKEIMLADCELQKVFYTWYSYGDGHITTKNGNMQIRTASSILARQIHDLILRLDIGIPTIFHRKRQPGGPTNRMLQRDIWQIHVNFSGGSRGIRHRDGFFARKLFDINTVPFSGKVYNFEVLEDHSYLVENLVVHNCEHILNRESSRQINDPHFLAGAIIMPPELPGWKGAQIKELSILEKTVPNLDKLYAEVAAEIPDADPKAWELSMQLLLLQARSSETKISASEIGRKIGSELVDASAEKRLYFKIEKGAKGCPISKPYGVVGEKSGMVHGCHDTMASAQKHLAAIYAATDPKSGYKPASKETQKNAETVKQHERRLAKEKAQEDTNNDSCPKCGADLSYCIDPNFCPNCGADLTEASLARDFNQEERKKLAKSGEALPDGSFPIVNEDDLRNAIRAIGRASNSSAAKAHIKKRAKALGLVNLIPDTWN